MTQKNREKRVVIKANIPSSLKLRFKVLCAYQKVTISSVLEHLIEKWIQANTPINNFIKNQSSGEELKELKGYIPESLKVQFKVSCVRKSITMKYALHNLIGKWMKASNSRN